MSDKQEKYAVSLGAYAPCADRFVTSGYQDELPLVEMLRLAASTEGSEAVEMDYPFAPPACIDVRKMRKILDSTGVQICTLEIDHYSDPKWKYGALTSNRDDIRRSAIDVSKRGMDAALELGVNQINLWLGHDGWDYPMEAEYRAYWDRTVEGIREIAQHSSEIKVCIEYKPKEPRAKSLVGTVGEALLVANTIDLPNVGVNIDTGHSLFAGENLAHSAVLCDRYDRLFYLHLNDNYRDWDHDMIVGTVHLWETLELLYWSNRIGYDGWYTLDIYPYRQDAVKSAELSIRNLKLLMSVAKSLDEDTLARYRRENNTTAILGMLSSAILE